MKKPTAKKMSGKALAVLISVLVFLASAALIAFTMTFFMSTLSSVADARKTDTTKSANLAGIDGKMLDDLLQFQNERTARTPLDVSHLNNPYMPLPIAPTAPAAPAPTPVTPPSTKK